MFSIIVISINRIYLVERLFLSLCRQINKNFEIVFIYGPSINKDDVDALCNLFSNLTIRTFESQDNCLSRSRNLALSKIRGDFFAIPDDDCVYEPSTLEMARELFEKYPLISAIIGKHMGLDESCERKNTAPVFLTRYAVFKNCPSYIQFYRSSILPDVGFFDENLGVGSHTPYQSGEETDFALRTMQAGFAIARTQSVLVHHPYENLQNPSLRRKVHAYAAGRMYLLRKHHFSFVFMIINVFYPLVILPYECLKECIYKARYRVTMFFYRLLNITGTK